MKSILIGEVLPYLPDSEVRLRLEQARQMDDATSEQVAETLGSGQAVTAMDTVPFCIWCAHHEGLYFEEAVVAHRRRIGRPRYHMRYRRRHRRRARGNGWHSRKMARKARKFGLILNFHYSIKKDSRVMILATLGTLLLLAVATIYRQQKVAGEEIAGIEIYYIMKDPKSGGSGGSVLKYRASGEKATRILQQLQLAPTTQQLGIHNYWIHSFYQVVTVRRNGRRSADWINLQDSSAWILDYSGKSQNRYQARLTPESLRYFRSLLSPQKSSSKLQNQKQALFKKAPPTQAR